MCANTWRASASGRVHRVSTCCVIRGATSSWMRCASASSGVHRTRACLDCDTCASGRVHRASSSCLIRGTRSSHIRCASACGEHIASTPVVIMVPAPVVEYIVPTPVVSYVAPAPPVYAAPAPVVEVIMPVPTVSFVAPVPAVYSAPAPVMEYIAPAPAVSCKVTGSSCTLIDVEKNSNSQQCSLDTVAQACHQQVEQILCSQGVQASTEGRSCSCRKLIIAVPFTPKLKK